MAATAIGTRPDVIFKIGEQAYAFCVRDRRHFEVTEQAQGSLVARVSIDEVKRDGNRDYFYAHRCHVIGSLFYFVVRNNEYRNRDVWSFDLTTGKFDCVLSPAQDPHFWNRRLVEFGSNCNESDHCPGAAGVITIYDLMLPKDQKKVGICFLEGGQGNWNCEIDRHSGVIVISNPATGIHDTLDILNIEKTFDPHDVYKTNGQPTKMIFKGQM